MRFELLARDASSGLRVGLLHTAHGSIPTPAFMPVGTLASVKGLTPSDVRASGASCVLANTYHLLQRPGVETVRRLGGLHALMRWNGPILTDSGGFQVFSLGGKVSHDGVAFDHTFLNPEGVIEAQEALGADLVMPLDECVAATTSRAAAEQALERTQAWWRRSLAARTRDDQALFVLVQGGLFADLRREAARAAAGEPAPGFAIGGLSIGEPKSLTAELVAETVRHLRPDRPRYLMGVGSPEDLVTYARLGIDLFDSVLPTRMGRTGAAWTDAGGSRLDLGRRAALHLPGALAEGCGCLACREWQVGALAALFQHREPLALRLCSLHNITVLSTVLDRLRTEASGVVYTGREQKWRGTGDIAAGDDLRVVSGPGSPERWGTPGHPLG
jgi:queuine tRNA-ribosyltransferase